MKYPFSLLVIATLLGCAPGEQGPAGPPGADGAPGPQGAPGPSGDACCAIGERLAPEVVLGNDGSKVCTGRMRDMERDEACTWQSHDDDLLCLPTVLDANAFNTFVDAQCTKPGFVARYIPAGHPEGTSVVRVLGGPLDGELLMRGKPVDVLYTNGSGLPCQPLVSDGFPPPYHHWPLFDADAFVSGVLAPAL